MLAESELADYFQMRNIASDAGEVIRNIRASDPSRRVDSGTKNVACRFASKKMGMTIQAESHQNELAAVVDWEFDISTHEFYDQPPKIKVEYQRESGRPAAHLITPDYFVLQDDFTGWVECKTEKWLMQHATDDSPFYVPDGNGGYRYPPGERYAAKFGLGFRVRSSSETNWVYHRNLEFLDDYFDERCPDPDPLQAKKILSAFSDHSWFLLKDLVECDEWSADTVNTMIARGELFVDLKNHLLAEPERTNVFRDRTTAESYRLHLASQQLPSLTGFAPITTSPGQTLLWDGKPWRILNVGDKELFLDNIEGVITTLSHKAFEQMVRQSVIQGVPQECSTNWDIAAEILRNASPRDHEGALYRYHCLFPETADGEVPKATDRAKRKWRALYRQYADLYGNGFLGLIPKVSQRGNRERKLDKAVIDIMETAIAEHFKDPTKQTLESCWGEVRILCEGRGLVPPSENAFRNQISLHDEHEIKEAREGRKAAYTHEKFHWRIDRTTPRHGERPFEIGHIDHTQLDLQFVDARTGARNLGKAWLTVLIDAFTRMILAWVLSFEEPSYRSCMLVTRETIRRHGRMPKYIVVDKGSEFKGIYFEVLLARLGCHKKIRPASKPRFGSIIERFFGINNQEFVHNLRGNNQALQKARTLTRSHDPRELAVWTLPAFSHAFERYLEETYSQHEHPALGIPPAEAMKIGLIQSGSRSHTLIPYTENFIIMCMPSTKNGYATIDSSRGIKTGYIYYWSPEFRDARHARKKVAVRYDPFDISRAFAWLGDHWVQCESEYAADFRNYSEKELQAATQEIRRRLQRSNSSKNRAINATMIARYLREIRATESSLMAERQHDSNITNNPKDSSRPQQNQDNSIPEQKPINVWDNLNLRIFGEFK